MDSSSRASGLVGQRISRCWLWHWEEQLLATQIWRSRGCRVDIDERSLESARRNLKPFPTMRVIRTSAYDLPFEDRFDLAFSIGVIHHLEHPERALEGLVRAGAC